MSMIRAQIGLIALAAIASSAFAAPKLPVTRDQEVRDGLGTIAGSDDLAQSKLLPADLNHDGIVNILDAALLRKGGAAADSSGTRMDSNSAVLVAGPAEEIVVEPIATTLGWLGAGSVMFLIRGNTTPLLGYSLDVRFVPQAGSRGAVVADVPATNFFDAQNLISAGGAVRDPFFSVIQSGPSGGVFVNTLTDDNSTVLAVDGVNDVLAQVFFEASSDACGTFDVELGPASALSDGDGNSVSYSFTTATITVTGCIPATSTWGLVACALLLSIAASLLVSRGLRHIAH